MLPTGCAVVSSCFHPETATSSTACIVAGVGIAVPPAPNPALTRPPSRTKTSTPIAVMPNSGTRARCPMWLSATPATTPDAPAIRYAVPP